MTYACLRKAKRMGRQCPLGGYALYLDCLECEEKACKRSNMQKNKIVIGIDQSYVDTGISIAYNGKIKAISSVKLKSCKNNTERRKLLKNRLIQVFTSMQQKASESSNCEIVCIIERIRLQSAQPGEKHFLNFPYIKGIGALNALIVDTAYDFDIPVYSVDTRSWKSQVVGSSKPLSNKYGIASEKWPTILYIKKLGWEKAILEEVSNKKKKGVIKETNGVKYTYNDNKADSACIALYGFIPKHLQKLEEEY